MEPDINSPNTKNEEESQIITLLHALKCDEVSVTSAVRLGKMQSIDGQVSYTRPLKIVLASVVQKDKILSNAKNLKGNKVMSRVFIQPDLTPNQRRR